MHMLTHGCQMMVTETSKTKNFWTRVFKTHFILVSNPLHQYNIFELTSFSGGLKQPTKQQPY